MAISELTEYHKFNQIMQSLYNSLGYDLNFMEITSKEMLEASDESFKIDYELLIELMKRALSKS